ncbi:unnamed protein product [Alopecurus aequalis]
MDAPLPAQPDAAAPPPSAAALPPTSDPPPNPTPSVPTAAPPTSDSSPAPAPTPIAAPTPAQTLEPPAPIPASARPPPARMRPPYTHLASPITMTSSSSPATAGASSVASAMPRGGVAIGLPAHPRAAQTPMGYTGFVPPPPLAHQFSPMHRGPDQTPPPASQLRQPTPGIQNIGMIGSLGASQMRPVAVSGPQQPRAGLPSSAAPSGSQMPGSQPRPGAISGPQQPRPGAISGPQQPRPGAISGPQQPRPGAISGPQQPRPGAFSGPQQPRPGLLSSATPSSSGSQMPGSQQTPSNVSSQFRPQQRPQAPQPRPYNVAQSAPMASHQQNVLPGQQQQLPQQQLLQQQQQQVPQQQLLQQQQQVPQQQLLQQQQQQQQLPQQPLLQQQLPQQQLLQQQQSQPQSSSQQNTALKNQQQAARTPVSLTQKPDTPTLQATNMQLLDMASADAAGESSKRLLSKRSIHELLAQIDPSERLDPEVEDVLIDIAEDFVESVGTFACSLAKHRKSSTLEAKDVLLHAERSWNITLPGFTGDEIKLYKKPHVNDIHRERLTLIKKSMASEGNTKSAAAQAAANQKNQAPKPPATGSP